MNDLLFVYGTLMNNIESTIASYLHSNSSFVGEGTFSGKLYDLGSYPGAIYDETLSSQVHGHIFQLNDAESLLKRLDLYEGIYLLNLDKNEYRRILVPVMIKNEIIECWVYVYNFTTQGLKEIPAGNYLQYLKKNELHQKFIKNH